MQDEIEVALSEPERRSLGDRGFHIATPADDQVLQQELLQHRRALTDNTPPAEVLHQRVLKATAGSEWNRDGFARPPLWTGPAWVPTQELVHEHMASMERVGRRSSDPASFVSTTLDYVRTCEWPNTARLKVVAAVNHPGVHLMNDGTARFLALTILGFRAIPVLLQLHRHDSELARQEAAAREELGRELEARDRRRRLIAGQHDW